MTGCICSRFALALALALAAAPAVAWEVDPTAPPAEFAAFNRHFSGSVYHFPRHGAAPLGLIGFEVYVDAAVDQELDDEPFTDAAIDGDLTGGLLTVARVGARKGLPGGIDVGAAYGRVLGSDIELVSADLQWAILEGGALAPALSLRLTGTRTLEGGAYDLDQYGAELLLSKGFAVLTPYVGGGVAFSRGTLDRALGGELEESETRPVAYAGLRLNLLLPKITVEVERGEVWQGAVKVGFGL